MEFRRAVGAGFYQTRHLLLECSGRYSNMLLLDGGRQIVEAARHIYPEDNRYRTLIPGGPYTPPPPISGESLDEWDCEAPGMDGIPRNLVGLGRPLISAIERTCCDSPPERLDVLRGVNFLKTCAGGAVYQSLGNYVTLFVRVLSGAEAMPDSSALEAARRVVVLPLIDRCVGRFRKKISLRLNRLVDANAKRIGEYEALLEDGGAADRLMSTGKLILENCWSIPPRSSEAELVEWTESGASVRIVALDPGCDAVQNAERYFARYRKKKAAADRARSVLPSLYETRDELSEQAALLDSNDDAATLSLMLEELSSQRGSPGSKGRAPGRVHLPPHRRYDFEWAGAVVYCGLSAKGNQYVTYRLARGDDEWLHAQGVPGAHVVLRFAASPDSDTLGKMLEIAASCAAYHSRGRESGRVRVDHTKRRFVRAIPGGSPSRVTYREFGTILADPAAWLRIRESPSGTPSVLGG
jgi:predicted ribosome quality control (RQC) complex YloA/Tae2 family protein